MNELGNLLGVWAHPDDEAFLTAGLMLKALRDGKKVHVVTATKGEAGSQDEERWHPSKIASVRERELAESNGILGIKEHRYLGYVDGCCNEVTDKEAVDTISSIIAELEPDSVVTFGPDGFTGHPDHKAMSRWTTEAFARSARKGARLYYISSTNQWIRDYLPTMNVFEIFAKGTPEAAQELAVDYLLPEEDVELKLRSLAAQVSQTERLFEKLGWDFMRKSQKREFLELAAVKAG